MRVRVNGWALRNGWATPDRYTVGWSREEGRSVNTYFYIVQIFVSVVLIGVLLLQARGSGFSATFSSDSSIYRTRRGVEKTLFNVTIVLAILFVVVSILSVALSPV